MLTQIKTRKTSIGLTFEFKLQKHLYKYKLSSSFILYYLLTTYSTILLTTVLVKLLCYYL